MAVGITVTGSSVSGFEITVTDATEGDRLRVERIDNSGYYDTVAVRSLDMISPGSSTVVSFDYEAPFNSDITYRASTYALSDLVTPISTAEATDLDTSVPLGFVMISQVFDATERVSGVVDLGGMKEWTTDANILSESHVLGREKSVVISDVIGGREGIWRIWNALGSSVDFDGEGAKTPFQTYSGKWRSVFKNGSTLLFRNDAAVTGFDDCYFKAKSINPERPEIPLGWNLPQYPLMSYTISYIEQDRPLTTIAGLGFTNWNDVYVSNADWQEVNDDHADWLSVLTDPTL